MMKKMLGLAVLSVLLALAVPAAAQDTIKIGATEPLSGTFKDIGERYLEGVQFAVKVINENGGLLGKKVEVIPIDSELKPDVATRKAQALILKDEVKFFCGGTGSSVGAAMSQLAEKENVIMFTFGMDASSMTGEKCNKNFFRPGGSTDGRSFALADLIVKKGYQKVAIIAQDYSFGQEAVAAFKKKLVELSPSAKIVAELYHPAGNQGLRPLREPARCRQARCHLHVQLGQRPDAPAEAGTAHGPEAEGVLLLHQRRGHDQILR